MTKQPIIIAGMPRAGTGLVESLLAEAGLFTGRGQPAGDERRFFPLWNASLMQSVGARWDAPEPARQLQPERQAMLFDQAVRRTRQCLYSRRLNLFTGLTPGSRKQLDGPWGWADPRNLFTLRIWGALLREAKLVLVHRSGIDVADSLARQCRGWLGEGAEAFFQSPSLATRWLDHRLGVHRAPVRSLRCLDPEAGFELWRAYADEAERQVARWPNPLLTLSYEELGQNPQSTIERLLEFAELPAEAETIERLAEKVTPTRPHARVGEDRALKALYERKRHDPLMVRLGYHQIAST